MIQQFAHAQVAFIAIANCFVMHGARSWKQTFPESWTNHKNSRASGADAHRLLMANCVQRALAARQRHAEVLADTLIDRTFIKGRSPSRGCPQARASLNQELG